MAMAPPHLRWGLVASPSYWLPAPPSPTRRPPLGSGPRRHRRRWAWKGFARSVELGFARSVDVDADADGYAHGKKVTFVVPEAVRADPACGRCCCRRPRAGACCARGRRRRRGAGGWPGHVGAQPAGGRLPGPLLAASPPTASLSCCCRHGLGCAHGQTGGVLACRRDGVCTEFGIGYNQ